MVAVVAAAAVAEEAVAFSAAVAAVDCLPEAVAAADAAEQSLTPVVAADAVADFCLAWADSVSSTVAVDQPDAADVAQLQQPIAVVVLLP